MFRNNYQWQLWHSVLWWCLCPQCTVPQGVRLTLCQKHRCIGAVLQSWHFHCFVYSSPSHWVTRSSGRAAYLWKPECLEGSSRMFRLATKRLFQFWGSVRETQVFNPVWVETLTSKKDMVESTQPGGVILWVGITWVVKVTWARVWVTLFAPPPGFHVTPWAHMAPGV